MQRIYLPFPRIRKAYSRKNKISADRSIGQASDSVTSIHTGIRYKEKYSYLQKYVKPKL